MDMEKITTARHEVLAAVEAELQEELIAAELSTVMMKEDTEALRVLFDEMGFDNADGALGEFFFLPVGSEQDTVGHFIASITLTDRYDMERSPELYAAMAILNTYIPCGAFSVSRDETVLMYKLVTPMPVALTKEALREEVDICMGNAIAVCDRYADLLLKVLDGEMDKDAVMEALGM